MVKIVDGVVIDESTKDGSGSSAANSTPVSDSSASLSCMERLRQPMNMCGYDIFACTFNALSDTLAFSSVFFSINLPLGAVIALCGVLFLVNPIMGIIFALILYATSKRSGAQSGDYAPIQPAGSSEGARFKSIRDLPPIPRSGG